MLANIKVISVREPQWADAEHTLLNVIAKFDHLPDEVPFTATQDDIYAHTKEVWDRAVAGEFGEIQEFVAPEAPPAPPALPTRATNGPVFATPSTGFIPTAVIE